MKRALFAAFGALMLAGSAALAGDASVPVAAANTAGAIVIDVDGIPQAVLFVSKTGEVAGESMDECRVTPACVALGSALAKAGKMLELNLRGSAKT